MFTFTFTAFNSQTTTGKIWRALRRVWKCGHRVSRPHTTGGNKGGVARNELCWEYRDLIFNLSAQLGFSNGAASCTNLPRVRPSVVRVRSWRLVRTRDFRRCVVRVSAAAADRCAQSGDPTRTEQGRSHVAARGSEFYRFTESKSPGCTFYDSLPFAQRAVRVCVLRLERLPGADSATTIAQRTFCVDSRWWVLKKVH